MEPSITAAPCIEVRTGPVNGNIVQSTGLNVHSFCVGICGIGFRNHKIFHGQQFDSCTHTADIILFVCGSCGCEHLTWRQISRSQGHSRTIRSVADGKLCVGNNAIYIVRLPQHNAADASGTHKHHALIFDQALGAVAGNGIDRFSGLSAAHSDAARPIALRHNITGEFNFESVGEFNTCGILLCGRTGIVFLANDFCDV